MKQYILFTLSARRILERISIEKNSEETVGFDLNILPDYSAAVLEESGQRDNAFFYQIEEVLKDKKNSKQGELKNNLIFLDFNKPFIDKDLVERSWDRLFSQGFKLLFPGESQWKEMVPFDRSASMSRNSTITFINKAILEDVENRLLLGIDFSKIKVMPSKYYAYRGLYLTDGTRINPKKLELDESKVLVLPESSDNLISHLLDETKVVTVRWEDVKAGEELKAVECLKEIRATAFDGEGLVSLEYAELINKELKDRRGDATSFQIRMPFTKGMLHAVDFKRFVKEHLPEADYKKLEIEDAFGIKRKLKDVEILLTSSMFKCLGWLRDYGKERKLKDPLKYFFKRMEDFGHTMYIGNTDLGLSPGEYVKLNYQFLNTLPLTVEELEKLIERHVDEARAINVSPDLGRKKLLNDENFDEEEFWSEDPRLLPMSSWQFALGRNLRFIKDPKISSMLKEMEKSLIRDVAIGRLDIKGKLKFLSDDLLMLLIIILSSVEGPSIDVEARAELVKNLNHKVIYKDKFFMADMEGLRTDRYYGIFRSPHLSRNELCALKPYIPDKKSRLYRDYFGHLRGVIMVSFDSATSKILGGADFDGDLVKVSLEPVINDRVVKCVYDEEGNRAYPIVDIPSGHKETAVFPSKYISGTLVKDTFSTQVGKISNRAVREGIKCYWEKKKKDENEIALYTIAVGLEIDSVKTGVRPKLKKDRDEDKKGAVQPGLPFLRLKDCWKDPLKWYREHVSADVSTSGKTLKPVYDEETDEFDVYIRAKSAKNNLKLFNERIGRSRKANIDKLPYYYLRALDEKPKRSKIDESQLPEFFFRFEEKDEWKGEIEGDARLDELKRIIGTYKRFNRSAHMLERNYDLSSYYKNVGKIRNILDREYNYREGLRLPRSEKGIDEALNMTYVELNLHFSHYTEVEEAIKKRASSYWSYVHNYDEKKEMLEEIIGCHTFSEETLEILCDTSREGYSILELALRDIMAELRARRPEEEVIEEILGDASGYDRELLREMMKCYKHTKAKNLWQGEAKEICRKKMLDLFGGKTRDAVKYAFFLGETADKSKSFFWGIFTAEDIAGLIY